MRVFVWSLCINFKRAEGHRRIPTPGTGAKRLMDVMKHHRHFKMVRQAVVPAHFHDILEDLQALAMAKIVTDTRTSLKPTRIVT